MIQKNVRDLESLFRFAKPDERVAYINRLFARIAPKYDFMNRLMSLGLDLTWRRKAIRTAGFNPESLILDLGIGSGDMSQVLIQEVPQTDIVGFDICAELIAEGRRKPGLQNPSHPIQWMLGDGRVLPFADNAFDGVVAGFSIRNVPELPKVFREMYRVLKPGGKMVLLDMVEPEHWFFRALFRCWFKFVVPSFARLFASDPEAYFYLYPSIVNFYNVTQIRLTFTELGFTNIVFQNLMLRMVTICVGEK